MPKFVVQRSVTVNGNFDRDQRQTQPVLRGDARLHRAILWVLASRTLRVFAIQDRRQKHGALL
jgi:hypothetical protein